MEPAGDSIVLEEEIDPNYEPTEKEVHEYASWLGMDLETEQDLFWIAREGLKAPLPENWKPCKTTDTEEIYYFNFATGQSTWDHPCDEYYRKVYDDHKKKRASSSRPGGATDGDERKKKEKEDVAELLGKKGSKKKKAVTTKATAEPLGPPVLARGAALGEKKPLPGLSGGKLKGLTSGSLGSASSLRPVASLGKLKGEAKDEDEGSAGEDDGDNDDTSQRKPSPRALSKPPLGSLLTKKPLSSASSLSKADSKAELDDLTSGFDQKKQKLIEEHAKVLHELQEEHEAKLSAQKKKTQNDLEELQEQEESKLKQRRKEFDKKMNDIENQYDKDESNLLRERKEKLKRMESDMELTLSQKKQELERDHQKEIQRLQSRLDVKLQELKDDNDRKEILLKKKSEDLSSAIDQAAEIDKLNDQVQRLEKQAVDAGNQHDTLRQAQVAAEERLSAATQQIESLQKQLDEANGELAHHRSRSSDPTTTKHDQAPCGECPAKDRRIVQLEAELKAERELLKRARESMIELQQQLESARRVSEADVKSKPTAVDDSELITLRQRESDLRRNLKEMEAASANELREWREKYAKLEEQTDRLLAEAANHETTRESLRAVEVSTSLADDVENLRNEISELNDQVAVLTKTNSQIKDQLLKESNEKRQLREQLNSALSDDSSRESSQKMEQQQRELDNLRTRLQADIATKDQEMSNLQEQLHNEQQSAEQSRRRLEAQVSKLESENRILTAESSMLKRQMEERLNEISQAGDVAEQQAAATVTKQKWEIEQLQSSLKLITRDKEELTARVRQLESEVDEVTEAKHRVEIERDNEVMRSKKKDTERDAIQQKLAATQEELDRQVDKTRSAGTECADMKTQLNKLKFKEQAAQEKLTHTEDELKGLEAKLQSQQSEFEKLSRDHRAKSLQLEEKLNAFRDLQGEIEILNEQLSEAKHHLAESRARNQDGGIVGNGIPHGGSEVTELRLRVNELDAKVDGLTQEKAQLMEKQRALTQKHLSAEASMRTLEAERYRISDEFQTISQELVKCKDRLEKKTREAEKLKADLSMAQSESESVELALNKEKGEKRDIIAQKAQLETTRKQLEATIESLSSQLSEIETTQGLSAMEIQGYQSKLRRLENELDTTTRERCVAQDERDALVARTKQQASDMAALETRIRLLRTENSEQTVRAKESEDDTSRQAEMIKRLEIQLNERDVRLRKESDEKENTVKQLTALRSEKEELENNLLAMKRKSESVEARYKDHEDAVARGDFQLKLRVQQLEAERDGVATGKDRAEQHAKSLEKELVQAKEELGTVKNELEVARNRMKSLTLERDEFQTALLQAKSSQSTARGLAYGATGSDNVSSVTADAMLVRLQLADVNKSELEQHLADVATQLELATRRCTLAETRCRDQGVELESLHVEIASLRSSMAKMHLSALETLPLVERLEYEHRKRMLKRDFSAQLRDFQEREEHSLMRQKARLRAQHEKLVEELVDEMDAKKQRRVEYEEQITTQMLIQLRSERDTQIKEMRKQMESELMEEERVLIDRKARRLESVVATVRQEEDDERARQREQRQALREQELSGKGVGDLSHGLDDQLGSNIGNASPGQLGSIVTQKSRSRLPVSARVIRQRSRSYDHSSGSDDSPGNGDIQKRQARKRSSHRRDEKNRSDRHENEINRWRQRLADETKLLDKAKTLVTDQKKQLKRQAEQIRTDKQAWKREWAEVDTTTGTGSHRVAISREMKAMIDHSTASWNACMQQLRERDEWITRRETKLRKMRRALAALKGKRHRSRSQSRGGSKGVRFGSSSPSSESDVDNQNPHDVDSDAVLDKLARLDGELASDASEFSSDDRWAAVAGPSIGREAFASGSYRYPLSRAFMDTGVAAYRLADPVDALPSSRLYRPSSLSTRSTTMSSSLSTSGRLSQRVWPTTAMRLTPHHRTAGGTTSLVSDAAVQRRIARWAHGREAMQHAATKQASWLSNLYQEVKAYGDTRAQASAEGTAPSIEE